VFIGMSVSGEDSDGRDDDKVLVGEFALGLLDAAEHQRVARRIAAEPALAAELKLWQSRLQSLDREFVETPPPANVFARVEGRLFGAPPQTSATARFWDNLALWRGLAAAGLAVAVIAVGFNVLRPAPDSAALANQLVASLEADGSDVKFVAFYNEASGAVRLVSLGGKQVPDKDYELWYIQGSQAPVSMGVIPVDARTNIPLDPKAQASIKPGTVLAVTLEPKGGSPSGAPTGPIVAKGAATAI
jgi:anti-sigma-K factor RskA